MRYGWLLAIAGAAAAITAAKAYRNYRDKEIDENVPMLPNREAVLAFRRANRQRNMAEAQIDGLQKLYYGRTIEENYRS